MRYDLQLSCLSWIAEFFFVSPSVLCLVLPVLFWYSPLISFQVLHFLPSCVFPLCDYLPCPNVLHLCLIVFPLPEYLVSVFSSFCASSSCSVVTTFHPFFPVSLISSLSCFWLLILPLPADLDTFALLTDHPCTYFAFIKGLIVNLQTVSVCIWVRAMVQTWQQQ